MKPCSIESLLKAANSSPESDTSVNLSKRAFLDEAECKGFFKTVRAKLFDIEEWRKNSSATDYASFEETGEKTSHSVISIGRFIRISLYGGGKYDWVRVVSIVDEPNEIILTVKPSYDPTQRPPDTSVISHFFGPEAANNFCIQRNEKTVAFYVIGLNEHQNADFTSGLIETARNAAIANIGYYTGLQKGVWKQFCSNFLKTDEEKEL